MASGEAAVPSWMEVRNAIRVLVADHALRAYHHHDDAAAADEHVHTP